MLTTDTFQKALDLLEAVHIAWFRGTTEQLFRELQLAGVLELAAAKSVSNKVGSRPGATRPPFPA
jgi:hypothetical protein